MRRLTTLVLTCALLFTMTAMATAAEKAVTVKGWVSDTMCAAAGNKKCDNKAHLQQGAKLALVTLRRRGWLRRKEWPPRNLLLSVHKQKSLLDLQKTWHEVL
jgi:hypothetical protein